MTCGQTFDMLSLLRESRLLSARSEVVARDKADGSHASRRRREASDREVR